MGGDSGEAMQALAKLKDAKDIDQLLHAAQAAAQDQGLDVASLADEKNLSVMQRLMDPAKQVINQPTP